VVQWFRNWLQEGEVVLLKEEVWARGKLLIVFKGQSSEYSKWCFGLDVPMKGLP